MLLGLSVPGSHYFALFTLQPRIVQLTVHVAMFTCKHAKDRAISSLTYKHNMGRSVSVAQHA